MADQDFDAVYEPTKIVAIKVEENSDVDPDAHSNVEEYSPVGTREHDDQLVADQDPYVIVYEPIEEIVGDNVDFSDDNEPTIHYHQGSLYLFSLYSLFLWLC